VSAARSLPLLLALMLFAATPRLANAGGNDIFNANCAVCHQPNGHGILGMYPPLADSIGRYVALPEGRTYLIHVVSFGMTGPISVHGEMYNGVMQPWPQLRDQDVAGVLNFILMTFNAKLLPSGFKRIASDEVKKARAANLAMSDIYQERAALIKSLAAHHI
jgi:mono/diheme cytochrome c family protein